MFMLSSCQKHSDAQIANRCEVILLAKRGLDITFIVQRASCALSEESLTDEEGILASLATAYSPGP